MSKNTWYRFEWEDGTVTIARGYSANEMRVQVRNHGKLILKTLEGYY